MCAKGRIGISFVKVLEPPSFHSHCGGGPPPFYSVGCRDPCTGAQTLMLANT